MATTLLVVKNRAYSKLAAAITAAATSLTVTAGEGANFPSTYPFHLTIDDEIVSCTNRSTDTLTIARAQQSTTGAAHAKKSYVALNITAKSMTDLNTAVNTIEGFFPNGSFSPTSDDGFSLGTASLRWSDLFLASGGVINWANGDATITHSTAIGGLLTYAGCHQRMDGAGQWQFREATQYLRSDASGSFIISSQTTLHLAIAGTNEIDITATTMAMNGNTISECGDIHFNASAAMIDDAPTGLTIKGGNTSGDFLELQANSADASPKLKIIGNGRSEFTGNLAVFGTLNVGGLVTFDGSVNLTAGDIQLANAKKIQFKDTGSFIAKGISAHMEITTDGELVIATNNLYLNGAAVRIQGAYHLEFDGSTAYIHSGGTGKIFHYAASTAGDAIKFGTGAGGGVRFETFLRLHTTDGEGSVEGQIWYDNSENTIKVCTGSVDSVVLLTATQTLTNKTLTSPVILTGVTLGSDGAGADLLAYGDTSGSKMFWDASDDRLEFTNARESITITGAATGKIGHTVSTTQAVGHTGWALGYFGSTTLSATSGSAGNAAGGVFEVNMASGFAAAQAGLVVGAYIGAYSNQAGRRPTAGLWIETIAGSGVSFQASGAATDMPILALVTSGAGTMSSLAIEFGSEAAGKTVTTTSGGMFYNQTIQVKANGTLMYIPLSTAEGSFIAGTQTTPLLLPAEGYGFELHYAGNNYSVTAIRARAQLKTTDTTATAQGAVLQAANNDGINAGCLNGALIEAIGKSDSTAATISTMRALLVNSEWSAKDTITDLRTLHVRTHTRDNATEGYFSNSGYLVYLENEAVGGNGQTLTAGIYFKGTNLSAGNVFAAIGIDMSGATFTTADIRLGGGATIRDINGYVQIGTTATSHTLTSTNDLMVSGKLEVNGYAYFDSHIGIMTAASPVYGIYYSETFPMAASGSAGGLFVNPLFTRITSARSGTSYGLSISTKIGTGNTENWTGAIGLRGVHSYIDTQAGGETITGVALYTGYIEVGGGMTVTSGYGLYIFNAVGAGTLTNQYGIYIEHLTKGVTLDYGLFVAGGGNVLGDSIYMIEAAAALADVAGMGQFWVKNDAPNTPYFTDDTGVDRQIQTADYAGIAVDANTGATTIDIKDNFVLIDVFDTDMPEAISNGAHGTNNITIGATGVYRVRFDMSGSGGGTNKTFEIFAFELNASGEPIASTTDANPVVVTDVGHPFVNGNRIKITGVTTADELNDRIFTVTKLTADTYSLQDDEGVNIDGTGFGAGTGGTATLATILTVVHTHRKFTTADVGSLSGGGLVSLTKDKTLELYIKGLTDATNPTVEYCSFYMNRVS